MENSNAEIKRICINDGHFGEDDCPFQVQPNFATIGSIIEIDVGIGRQFSFLTDDSMKDLLRFKPKVIHEEYNLSGYPVDILSLDNIFIECDNTQRMIFPGKRSGNFCNFTMDFGPGYK